MASAPAAALLSAAALAGCGRIAFDRLLDGRSQPDAIADALADASLPAARTVHAGGVMSCTLETNGDVWCWGASFLLANGNTSNSGTPIKIAAPPFTTLEVNDAGACGITLDRTMYCWGSNTAGALGVGVTGFVNAPTLVPGESAVAESKLGYSVGCVRRIDGTVACAGAADQLGDGSAADRATYGDVPGITDAIALTAGDVHACALRASGQVTCWGQNYAGQLGDGTLSPAPTPTNGPTGSYTTLAAGDAFTCALGAGRIDCWGENTQGQLGEGTTSPYRVIAMPAFAIADAQAMALGNFFVTVLHADHSLTAWGTNSVGELGIGNQASPQLTEAQVPLASVATISSRTGGHTCAVHDDSSVSCWGANNDGQLGNGFLGGYSTTPLSVLGLP